MEIDEFWSFVQKKGKAKQPDEGEHLGCPVQDRGSRFFIACAIGPLSADVIECAVTTTVQRTRASPLFVAGFWLAGLSEHPAAGLSPAGTHRLPVRSRLVIPETITLTQTVKHRDAHGRLLPVEIRAALGAEPESAGTVHVERPGGALRDRESALTRKTHTEALRDATWDALVDFSFAIFSALLQRCDCRLRRRASLSAPISGEGCTC